MGSLIILLVIWALIGLLLGYVAANMFKGGRPFGLYGDLAAGLIAAILTGLADWTVVPQILPNLARVYLFGIALIEPAIVALIVLWLIRYLKR